MANKYYDLARAGDAMAAGHYRKLALHARVIDAILRSWLQPQALHPAAHFGLARAAAR